MKTDFLLWLEKMPITIEKGKAKVQSYPEYTWHKFNSLDEALLTLYLVSASKLNPITASRHKDDYMVNIGRIYDSPKGLPVISFEQFNKKLETIPWNNTKNIDRLYAMSGNFSSLTPPVREIFQKYLDEDKYGTVHLANYKKDTRSISEVDIETRQKAWQLLEEKYNLHTDLDYVKVEHRSGNAILYPPSAIVSDVTRHRDFIAALRNMIEDHIAPTGYAQEANVDIDERSCSIHRATDNKQLLSLYCVISDVPKEGLPAGFHLQFHDKDFKKAMFDQHPQLSLLPKEAGEYITLATSTSGYYWDIKAQEQTLQFIRETGKKESLKHSSTTRRLTPGRHNKGLGH